MREFPVRHSCGAFRWTLLALIASVSVSAHADPPANQTPQSEIPIYDVYVTSERDLVEEVTTVRKISEADIEEKNARNLDEALVREPSIVVRRAGEGVARIDLRGLRTRQILMLVDGVPFYSTEDGNFDPSLIPSNLIDEIDVTYSNSSVLYGDGPLAGVLQVRTRSAEEGVQTRGRGDYREGDQYLGQVSVAGAVRGFEGFAAGSYLDSDTYPLPGDFDGTLLEGGGNRENADRRQGNALVKLGYAPSKRGRVDLLVDYRHAEFGVPWTAYGSDDPYGRNPNFRRMNDLQGFSTQLSGQLQPYEDLELRSWAYVTRQQEDRGLYDDRGLDSILERNSFQLEGTTLVTGGAVHGRYDLGAFGALRFAANGRFESFDSDGLLCEVRGGCDDEPFTVVDESHDLAAWSIGLEYEFQPVEQAGVVLGYGHAFLDADGGASDDGSLFLAGVYYDFPTGTRLRGSVAHKLRFPSIRQLYDVDGGNPDLDAERCWCFELGIEQRLPLGTTLGFTGYWLVLDDFIERLTSGDPFENRQELRNRGFEVTATSRPWEPLFLRVAYTFLDARDVSSDSPYDRLHNRPRHKFDAMTTITLPWQMDFRVGVSWVANTSIDSRTEPVMTRRLPDFVFFELKLVQRFWEDRTRLYAGVDNVLDEEWTYNYGFPQAGRTFFGGIELRY
jgi:outer membrane receptor protein involved in Fe transport